MARYYPTASASLYADGKLKALIIYELINIPI